MNIIMFGAGAIGSFIGALLQLTGHEVGIVGREAHVRAIQQHGLTLEDRLTKTTFNVRFSAVGSTLSELLSDFPCPDWVVVTTKAWANMAVAQSLQKEKQRLHLMKNQKNTKLCVFQNGMGNELPFFELLGVRVVFRGVTAHGCYVKEPGHVVHVGEGFSNLGLVSKELVENSMMESSRNYVSNEYQEKASSSWIEEGKKFCNVLTNAGLKCEWEDDLLPTLYTKLAVNCVINSLTAVFEVPNGELTENQHVRPIFDRLLFEVATFVHQLCPKLSPSYITEKVLQVVSRTAPNYSSTLQDLFKGRKTEIDYLCGYLLSQAQKRHVDLPQVALLLAIIKFKEEKNVRRAITST